MPTVQAAGYAVPRGQSVEPLAQAPTAFQNISAPADAFGAGIGEALTRLSGQAERASDAWTRIGLEYDKTAAQEAFNNVQTRYNNRMYGDPNVPGDMGFLGKEGRDAMDSRQQVWNDTRGDLNTALAGLSGQQRRLFDEHARALLLHAQTQIGSHTRTQFGKYQDDTDKAGLELANKDLVSAAISGDNNAFDSALGQQAVIIDRAGRRNGWSEDRIQSEKNKLAQDAVIARVHGYGVRGDHQGALDFLEANASQFTDANKLEDLRKEYTTKRDTGAAADAVDEAFGSPPRPRGMGGGPRGSAPAALRTSKAAQLLGPYAVDNAKVGGPSGVEGVDSEFAQRIDTMVKAMPDNVRQKFTIISGYRSDERQAQVNPSVKNSKHTSEGPGTAFAVDTTNDPDVIDWINKNGKRFGVDYTLRHLPNEQNHLEMVGPGGGRMTGAMTRAYNVGNIRSGETGFRSYGSQESGIRAISDQLDRYAAGGFTTAMNPDGGPINTVRKIISTWSPPNENNTPVLIDQAAKTIGVSADQVLDMKDPATKAKVVEAIIRQEQGGLPAGINRSLISRAVAAGGGPSPARGPAEAPAADEVAVGDSIAAHLIRKAGVAGKEDATTVANRRPGDTAVSGFGPNAIRDEVIPNMSDNDIRGKHVILSSGVTNKPGEIAAVTQQIQALRNRGAANITLLGVGNDPKLAGVNDKLAEIAAANNAAFAGPMRKVAGDKIHSGDNQDLLAQVREAKGVVQPDTPGAPPSMAGVPSESTGQTGPAPAPAAAGSDPNAPPPATTGRATRIPDIDKIITGIASNPNLTPEAREKAISQATTRYNHIVAATQVERREVEKDIKKGLDELEAGRDWKPPSDETLGRVFPPAKIAEYKEAITAAQERKQYGISGPTDRIPDIDKLVANIRANPKMSPAEKDDAIKKAHSQYNEVLAETRTEREKTTKDIEAGIVNLQAGRDYTPPSDAELARLFPPAAIPEIKRKIGEAQEVQQYSPNRVPGIPDIDQIRSDIRANPNLSDTAKEKAVEIAERQYQQRLQDTHIKRTELTKGIEDGIAALSSGKEWTPPSTDTMRTLLPPSAIQEINQKITQAQDYGRIRNSLWYASPEEIAEKSALVERGLADTTSPGYEQRQKYAADFKSVVEARDKVIRADPAAFALGSPAVSAAAEAAKANPTPETTQAAIRANLAEQYRLGIRRPEDQRVLPKEQAANMVSQVANLDPAKAGYSQTLDAYQQTYGGEYWNKAFGELVHAGLPDTVQILGTMSEPSQVAFRPDFERMIKFTIEKGGAEKLKAAAGTAGKDVDAELERQMEQFRNTVQGDVKLYNTVRNAVRDLAYYYAMGSNDGKAAVQKAYEGILGRKYDFTDTYRAPKGTLGTVDAAAHEQLAGLTPANVRDPGGGDPRLTPEYRQRAEYDAIMNGRWVNNQNDDGIRRMALRRDGSMVPAVRADGSIIEFKFSDAPGIVSRAPPPPPFTDPMTGQPMTLR